jgi:hypothetical protein
MPVSLLFSHFLLQNNISLMCWSLECRGHRLRLNESSFGAWIALAYNLDMTLLSECAFLKVISAASVVSCFLISGCVSDPRNQRPQSPNSVQTQSVSETSVPGQVTQSGPTSTSSTATNSISPFSLSVDGNLAVNGTASVAGALTVGAAQTSAGNIAMRPPTGTNNGTVCYAAYWGNDNNLGLDEGAPKQSIMACYDDVLGSGGGTIKFMDGGGAAFPVNACKSTDPPGCGIWIMGSIDPNYASPPAGWRKQKAVNFQGVGLNPVAVNCGGGQADNVHPCIWLSGTNGNINFANIHYQYPSNGIILGCNSNNQCTDHTGGVNSVHFDNIDGHINENPGRGPNVFIGSNTFWIFFTNSNFSGNPAEQVGISNLSRSGNVVTVTTNSAFTVTSGQHFGIVQASDDSFDGSFSVAGVINSTQFTYNQPGPTTMIRNSGTVITDKQIPIVIDPGSGSGSGLIFVSGMGNQFYSMGCVRLWPGTNGGGVYVNGVTVEGDFIHVVAPPIWVGGSTAPTMTRAQNIELADAIGPTPVVEVDNSAPYKASQTVVSGVAGTTVGPMTWLDGVMNTATVVSPLRQGQQGFFSGRVEGGSDVGRGIFSPVAAQAINLANTNPSSWTSFNGGVVTTGITAPDGTSGAGQFSGGAGAPGGLVPVSGGPAIATGVVYVFGSWVRSQTANGYGNTIPVTFATNYLTGAANRCNNSTVPVAGGPQRYQGDGQWDWVSGVCKITIADTTVGLSLQFYSDTTHTIQVYAPVVLGFAPGAISDNQAYEIANNLSAIPTNCIVGAVCMMPGQKLGVAGSTQFMGLFTHANTANRIYYFPDASGHVALVDIPQTWSASQTFGAVKLTDATIGGETMSSIPRAAYSAFLPGALNSSYIAATFTPGRNIIVERVEITLKTGPQTCSSNAVARIAGSNSLDFVIASNLSDSGPISLPMDQSTSVQVVLFTPAQGCAIPPQDANVVVSYRMQ